MKTLTVYLGSSGYASEIYKDAAKELGQAIATHKAKLVYGGMDAGLMGLVANEAINKGAHVTGIVPKQLKDSERIHPHLSETILVETLWERKQKMFLAADVILSLPGGFGTLDESLEVLHWSENAAHGKKLILINIANYWDDLIEYLQTLKDFNKDTLIIANNVSDAFEKISELETLALINNDVLLPHYEDEILKESDTPIVSENATVKDTYFAVTALGLKQLGKHNRSIGFLNKDKRFTALVKWIKHAADETFITQKCLKLFDVATTKEELEQKLASQKNVNIDLHNEKWGESVTESHLAIIETK